MDVSIHRGAMPQATSISLAPTCDLGRLTSPSVSETNGVYDRVSLNV